jgi:hypothetical protein
LCAIFLKTSIGNYYELKQYLDLRDEKKLDSIISNGITMLIKLREQENIESKMIISLLLKLNDLKHPVPKEKLLVLKKD